MFVSSTFRDMKAERDLLVKEVFPKLRKMCEERGVAWSDVDLRWGVTDEQKAEGMVLPICLEEIQRCRPYFIGILGRHYGWVPNSLSPELIAQYGWLAEDRLRSVTELEIVHGVLNNPAMADCALFYIRNPAYQDGLPREEGHRLRRLKRLKSRIRNSGMTVRDGYENPEAFADLVMRDLSGMIERRFPSERHDAAGRETAEHEGFAERRAELYICRRDDLDLLDRHAVGSGPPLIVTGEAGAGKSSLLAAWALAYREKHPDDMVHLHFAGANPEGGDWAAMLRRFMSACATRLGTAVPEGKDPPALKKAFAEAIRQAPARRIVLVLDGLDELEDTGGSQDLGWLPESLPANLRLVVSTRPGRPLAEAARRGWNRMTVQPLPREARRQLVIEHLARYSKNLSAARVERVVGAEQSCSPLFLRTLIEELRIVGSHEDLDVAIEGLLAAPDVPSLYARVLERWERDYEKARPGLVRDSLSLLYASRRGLLEAELLDLLGSGASRLPQSVWSPFHLALDAVLRNHSGLLRLGDEYIRRAVRVRYLCSEVDLQRMHLRLGEYFSGREIGPRMIDETLWQWSRTRQGDRLAALLKQEAFFDAAWDQDWREVLSCWQLLERCTAWRVQEVFHETLATPSRVQDLARLWRLGSLLELMGHLDAAFQLRRHIEIRARSTGQTSFFQAALGGQASILQSWGRLEESLEVSKEQERVCRLLKDMAGLQNALGRQASVLRKLDRKEEAMARLEEQERLSRQAGDDTGLSAALGNQAAVVRDLGWHEEALQLLSEQERICRQTGDRNGLRISLSNQALNLQNLNRLDEAMALRRQEEALARELEDTDGLRIALGNQALILGRQGRLDESLALHKQEEALCREIGQREGLRISLGNQVIILTKMNRLQEADDLSREKDAI